MLRFITKYAPFIATMILTIFAIISLRLAWTDALTFDEVAHIPAGYSYVALGDYRLNPEHPPILKALSGLAILGFHPTFDTTQKWWTQADANGEYGQWAAGRHLLHEAGNNTDMLTFFARVPIIIIAVLFGAFLFAWARRLSGALGGIITLLLYTLSPNILGHDHFVTTDLGIAAAIAVAFAALLRFVRRPTWQHALLAGVVLGLAQCVKFSAVVIIPFFILLVITYPLLKARTTYEPSRIRLFARTLVRACVGGIVSIFVIWLVYAPFTLTLPDTVLTTIAPIKFATDDARNTFFRESVLTLNHTALTRPFAMYLQGLGQVLNRVDGGNGAYFLGEVSSDGFPLYFPIVFLIKETLPHLVFMIIAIVIGITGTTRFLRTEKAPLHKRLQHYFTTHITELTLIVFIIFYAYISITGNLNIGYRHLMPIIPLIYLLVGTTIARAIKENMLTCDCRHIAIITIALFIFLIVDVAMAYPYYTSYFNQTVGGPKNGYHFVTDSNADWGQDAKRLKKFLDQHPEITKIRVDYFGGDDIARRLGERYIPWWDSKRPLETGWYAISVNYLQGSIYSKEKTDTDSYRFLRGKKPRYQVGTSILIYLIDTKSDADTP